MACQDCKCNKNNISPLALGGVVADFSLQGFWKGDIHQFRLSDYRGKWVVVFFYPGDFTFVCPTELDELAEMYEDFKKIDTEVLSVSTDSVYVHKAWHDESEAIRKVEYPMLSDSTHETSKYFGVYDEKTGKSQRGTFIINPEGALVAFEISDNSIGRNTKELMRKIQAAQFVKAHNGKVCPASWMPGDEGLTPGMDLVGKI